MSTTVCLTQPLNRKFEIVEVEVGDLVKVTEWNRIVVKGIVTAVDVNLIVVSNAEFIEGCYEEYFDYSEQQKKDVFAFNLADVAQIEVAKFEKEYLTFEKMVGKALNVNYCGSEKIVMSSMFWNAYSKEVRNSNKSYGQCPIEIDETIDGLYVYAVPNEESAKHTVTPKYVYRVEYYTKSKGKQKHICTDIISSFEDEIDDAIKKSAARVKAKIKSIENKDIEKLPYRLLREDSLVGRGVA